MKEIGGYFELELRDGAHFHKDAIALNSARNSLKYILTGSRPSRVYLPSYCCDSLIEPLEDENINYSFYSIDKNFEIIEMPSLKNNERIIYINYLALKARYINNLHLIYGQSLIVDNTQAFYERPIPGIDTFYSPRKFFGVPDGGYLYTQNYIDMEIVEDQSLYKCKHLLGRIEGGASDFYGDFKNAESTLIRNPIKLMSKITAKILQSLDYDEIALKRKENFLMLHSKLKAHNRMKLQVDENFVPMVYPYISTDVDLYNKLIKNKIFTAKYWADAVNRTSVTEANFINNMINVPIDQRLDIDDMMRIIGVIMNDEH